MTGRRVLTTLAAVAALGLVPVAPPPTASAVSALVMGGTDQPDPEKLGDYLPDVHTTFLSPFTACSPTDCDVDGVVYPAEFWPFPQWGGAEGKKYDRSVAEGVVNLEAALRRQYLEDPDEPVVLFGASQSATVVTFVKRTLAAHPEDMPAHVEIVLIGNPNRPNGGLLARFAPLTIPVLEFTGSGGTPTGSGIPTTDIAFQYDIAADFPKYPLNLFALLNSIIGIDIHGDYLLNRNGYTEAELQAAMQDPANQQTYGDTTYITIPTKRLPLLAPLRQLGVDHNATAITEPLAALLEPTLRVLVELGYDRGAGYGRVSGFGLLPRVDPVRLTTDLVTAVSTGLRDARAAAVATSPRHVESPRDPEPDVDQTSSATEHVEADEPDPDPERRDRRRQSETEVADDTDEAVGTTAEDTAEQPEDSPEDASVDEPDPSDASDATDERAADAPAEPTAAA
ncbi:hypothetical protein BCA37_25120 [Mycobacterium sp. djl-10]|nr:hypothetical protein BCA37_25120 [Mycobacterium sp. djl-10]